MLGAFLAFLSAAFFGLNNASVRRGVLGATVLQGMAITVPLGVPLFLVMAAIVGAFPAMAAWPVRVWLLMAAAGVVHFVFGRYGNYRATQALGATLSTPVQQLSILVSLVAAVLFLGEQVNAVNIFGIVLVMAGPAVVLKRRGTNKQRAAAAGFEPDYLAGTLWGAACALGYGISPLLIAMALDGRKEVADSVGGVFVSYLAATVVVLVLLALVGGRRYMTTMQGDSGKWFVVSAVFVALSQLFRYVALAFAPVSVVVPIQRLSVVFRILFNRFINRDHEVMDGWVLASIAIALIGVMALTIDTQMLLSWLGLGEATYLSAPLTFLGR